MLLRSSVRLWKGVSRVVPTQSHRVWALSTQGSVRLFCTPIDASVYDAIAATGVAQGQTSAQSSRRVKVKKPKPVIEPPTLLPFTAISLYRFLPLSDEEIQRIVTVGPEIIKEKCPNIRGTLLVATEGVNGQFCVPTADLTTFHEILTTLHNGLFADLVFNKGQEWNTHVGDELFPFKRLRIKHKKVVLTDKIVDTVTNEVKVLNWNDAGPELSPEDWHKELQALSDCQSTQSSDTIAQDSNTTALPPLLLDCRNDYESDIGTFANAIALNTVKFSETWDAFHSLLDKESRQRRILTFCTGGVRCVKTNAYLKQVMGFENIGRLRNGIIAYDKWLETNGSDPEMPKSLFLGKNFLFDRRRLRDDKAIDEARKQEKGINTAMGMQF